MEVKVDIPEPLWSVMSVCEVFCVAGCCGLDAYDISPEPLCEWSHAEKGLLLAEALRQLDALMKESSGEDFYFSQHMNYCGTGPQWVEVLSRWKGALEGAAAACGGEA